MQAKVFDKSGEWVSAVTPVVRPADGGSGRPAPLLAERQAQHKGENRHAGPPRPSREHGFEGDLCSPRCILRAPVPVLGLATREVHRDPSQLRTQETPRAYHTTIHDHPPRSTQIRSFVA